MVGATDVMKVGDWFTLSTDMYPCVLRPEGTLILIKSLSLKKGTSGSITRFWRQIHKEKPGSYPPGQHVELEFEKARFWIPKCYIEPSIW